MTVVTEVAYELLCWPWFNTWAVRECWADAAPDRNVERAEIIKAREAGPDFRAEWWSDVLRCFGPRYRATASSAIRLRVHLAETTFPLRS